MPFKSDAQRKLMYAVANNPAVAKKTGISKKVADKFIQHKAEGGVMATKKFREDEGSAEYKAKERRHVEAMKKAGVPKNIIAEEKKEAGLKKGGCVKKYAFGGMTRPTATPSLAKAQAAALERMGNSSEKGFSSLPPSTQNVRSVSTDPGAAMAAPVKQQIGTAEINANRAGNASAASRVINAMRENAGKPVYKGVNERIGKAKGGTVKKAKGGGVESKGKTRGRMV